MEFWTQQEALDQLQNQILDAISDSVPIQPIAQALPVRPQPPASKSSFFGRKSTSSEPARESKTSKPPVSVTAELDEVHFRSENDYGLYETLRGRCVLVTVEVR